MHKKQYTKVFKQETVRLAQRSGNKVQGNHSSMQRRWEKQLQAHGEKAFPGKGYLQNEELEQLQRENQRLKETVEILKKAVGIFSNRPQ